MMAGNQTINSVPAALIVAAFVSQIANAHQAKPNKLPPCPRPDYLKETDIKRIANWSKCWETYQTILNTIHQCYMLEVEWSNGALNGVGRYAYASGRKYVGSVKKGREHGRGIYTYKNGGAYIGDFRDAALHGLETKIIDKKSKYVGNFRKGRFNGRGTVAYANRNWYGGEFKNGKFHGFGEYRFFDGAKHVGEYRNVKPYGPGAITFANGDKYIGEFKDGEYSGRGTYYFLADNAFKGDKYIGHFKKGKSHGSGTYTHASGKTYTGTFRNGKKNGHGIQTNPDGSQFEGIWKNDRLIRKDIPELSGWNKLSLLKEAKVLTNYDGFVAEPEMAPKTRKQLEDMFCENKGCTVSAIYTKGVIYYDKALDPSNIIDHSIMIHEMIHQIQRTKWGDTYTCSVWMKKERQAYKLQALYLHQKGYKTNYIDEVAASVKCPDSLK